MKTVVINRFDGGMTNDYRSRTSNVAKVITNLDIFTDPNKLIPYRDSEDGDSSHSTNNITSFSMAKTSGTSPADVYNLYGLGNNSNKAKIYYKNLISNIGNATWSSTANNESTGTTVCPDCFVHYSRANAGSSVNNSGILFGFLNVGNGGTAKMFGYDPTGATAFTDDWTATGGVGGDNCPTTIYRVAQGLVHSKDDALYIPYDNKIASNSFATGSEVWAFPALTLPTYGYIPCISEYRNFLAIAHRPISNIGANYVYLWERNTTSLTTLAEKIYWGDEPIAFIEEIEGMLIGVSIVNTYIGTSNRLIFRVYDGYAARKVLEITSSSITIDGNKTAKQKINNRFFFTATITIDGVARRGVWSFGRTNGQWSLIHERTPNNDTSVGSGVQGFAFTGDYLFQSYTTAMTKTNDSASYTATAIYETIINPGMPETDLTRNKQLTGISVGYNRFPSGGSLVLKYRVDATTAWSSATTIFTESTSGVYLTEAIKDSSGNEFTAGREYEFRIETTGGVEITEVKYTYETLESTLPL